MADSFKTEHKVGTREEWLQARHQLLTAARRQVPAVRGRAGSHRDAAEMPPKDAQRMSAFALEDGIAYHTYSAYARGVDVLWNMFQWLDRAPLGRNESDRWYRLHDGYPHDPETAGLKT